MSDLPYEFGPVEFGADSGVNTMVEMRVPHRGVITGIRIFQTNTPVVAADFTLFTKKDAAKIVAGLPPDKPLPGGDPGLYAVFGLKKLSASQFVEFGSSYPYRNRDGTYSDPVRRLWLVINPTGTVGSGTKNYALTLSIMEPTMSG